MVELLLEASITFISRLTLGFETNLMWRQKLWYWFVEIKCIHSWPRLVFIFLGCTTLLMKKQGLHLAWDYFGEILTRDIIPNWLPFFLYLYWNCFHWPLGPLFSLIDNIFAIYWNMCTCLCNEMQNLWHTSNFKNIY